jgi:hypothetical protein
MSCSAFLFLGRAIGTPQLARFLANIDLGNTPFRFGPISASPKTLIGLSGGALVLSMTFIAEMAPAKVWLPALFGSWISFTASIVCVIFSMRSEQNMYNKEVRKFTSVLKEFRQTEDFARAVGLLPEIEIVVEASKNVQRLNRAALILFTTAVILLGVFVAANLLKT